MLLVNASKIGKWLSRGLNRAVNYLENNNNPDFASNGESVFIDGLADYWCAQASERIVIFDVGGNKGTYTQLLLDKANETRVNEVVHIFEPTKACFKQLVGKFGVCENVVLNNVAASDQEGKRNLFYDKPGSGLASLHDRDLEVYGINEKNKEEIRCIRLENYIDKNDVGHIHLLKMDIEGHELFALSGMGRYLNGEFVDFIQFEYGGANLDSRTTLMDIWKLLERCGFVVTKVMRHGLEQRTYHPSMDNFQYSNYVAVARRIVEQVS